MRTLLLPLGAWSAAMGVALGAFGAHGLRSTLSPDLLSVYETAVRYQMYHSFGMMIAGLLLRTTIPGRPYQALRAGWLFALGIVLFSGSLYALALSGIQWLGFITPFGGLAWIAGWILLGLSLLLPAQPDR